MIYQYRIITVLFIISLLLMSCKNPFHPALRNRDNDLIEQDTPLKLLQNLENAYKQKNLVLYRSCLAPDFRFELLSSEVNSIGIDWNHDGIKDSWWGFEQEVEFHRNLFYEGSSDGFYPPPDQINLRMQIPPEDKWEFDTEVGHEGWIIIPCLFDLQLLYTISGSAMASNGTARFYLKSFNNKWYIAIWRDESNI